MSIVQGKGIDLKRAYDEFSRLKSDAATRNNEYWLLRQAVQGNFRWPRDWPKHIPKLTHNLCKPVTERFATYLMGKGFSYNLDRPNDLEHREAAERTEKILRRLLRLSKSELQFDVGARTGAQLGRTVFKVYNAGDKGHKHACFAHCQPDYFYGVPAGDANVGEFATVYYSYPVDILEAERLFGPGDYKSEESTASAFYDTLPEHRNEQYSRARRIPVLEVWTRDAYALVVGGVTKYNGENPFKWSSSGKGFVPFVVIENIRNSGEATGEADIAQARTLNEHLNYLISRKFHVVNRWLMPTVTWEGAPTNAAEILSGTVGGGGFIPTRLGSRLSFLAYDRPNQMVLEMEQALRLAILESTGMSEIALQGTVSGSVNTGPALAAQFQPVLSTIEKKRTEWQHGLQLLFAMLLNEQERLGDSKALGSAVINQTVKSASNADGELVPLSGADIRGLRDVMLSWPGVLPKDDFDSARLEMEKASQGFQSIYTTLEKLGEEYPDDELARIRMENQDPYLRGEKVAEQVRAQTPLIKAQMDQETALSQAEMSAQAPPEDFPPEMDDAALAEQGDIGARLRELRRRAQPSMNTEGDMPVIEAEAVGY